MYLKISIFWFILLVIQKQTESYSSNEMQKVIPSNFFEAVSLIHQKRKYVDEHRDLSYKLLYNNDNLNIWPYVRNLLKNLGSMDINNLQIQFPNLTESCMEQVAAFVTAYTTKQDWTISGLFKKINKFYEIYSFSNFYNSN